MNRLFHFAIVITLVGMVGSAFGEPTELGLAELERITAAGYEESSSDPAPNGGAIVGNGSLAVIDSIGEVILDGEAQANADALNLVNSSESAVANGVNVFDGSASGNAALVGTTFDIEQRNVVVQDQRRLSSLPSYERGANIESTLDETGSGEGSSSRTVFDQVVDLVQTIVLDEAVTDGSFVKSGGPTLRIDADAALTIDNELPFGIPEFDLNGDLLVEFRMPSAGNSVGVVFNGEIDFVIDGGNVFIDTEAGVSVEVDLPDLLIGFDAMGCVAVNGDCSINGSREESTTVTSDHSTLFTLDRSETHTDMHDNSGAESVQAAFMLNDAQAEYIVVDESTIDVSAVYLVSLAGSAQSNLQAMNVVNAAGSAVANGINISRHTAGTVDLNGQKYNISQINNIRHSR